ncbi:MAG: hypothetical protein P4L49_00315 [Desulfosporosinus sp.]|nr:hypothetical protein [Desulfosporosinus sp.]
MTEEQTTKLSREQLYDEIWEISVSGVAKKYNVPYAKLVKLCKETNIPYPPSGYWTQLNFGKLVTKTTLPKSSIVQFYLKTRDKKYFLLYSKSRYQLKMRNCTKR